jgi:hypothetical protein
VAREHDGHQTIVKRSSAKNVAPLINQALQLKSFVGRPSASLWRSQLNAGTFSLTRHDPA